MNNNRSRWVLGQKVTLYPTSGDYDLVMCESPSGAQGPPPHIHSKYKETFLVIEGELEFVINGETKICKAGESIDVALGTLHTFNNKSDISCIWVNIHSPKGFSSFFKSYGIPENEDNAIAKSLHPEIIEKVLETASDFDMEIPLRQKDD